jgi:hypothetical protein
MPTAMICYNALRLLPRHHSASLKGPDRLRMTTNTTEWQFRQPIGPTGAWPTDTVQPPLPLHAADYRTSPTFPTLHTVASASHAEAEP